MTNYLRFTLLMLLLFAGVGSASATVTLQFSQGGIGATNFSNSSGVATNGMSWGIVVDTTGNGFSSGNYDALASSIASSQALSVGSVLGDDYFVPSGLQTQTLGAPFFSGAEAGIGGITNIASLALTNGISSGDAFAILWFETNSGSDGAKYGFFTDPSFTIPADGNTTPFTTPFVGADPTRSANLTFGGTAAPEPSRTVLAFFGLAMVGLRRRRR